MVKLENFLVYFPRGDNIDRVDINFIPHHFSELKANHLAFIRLYFDANFHFS